MNIVLEIWKRIAYVVQSSWSVITDLFPYIIVIMLVIVVVAVYEGYVRQSS